MSRGAYHRAIPVTARPGPSCRPARPVRSDSAVPPDDLLCTWAWRITSTEGNGTGYWELKYIHSGCSQHACLPRAS